MTLDAAEGKYYEYLEGHIGNIQAFLEVLNKLEIPYVVENYDKLKEICSNHDKSKYEDPEFEPYRKHFYPINDEEELETEAFYQACDHHTKHNKHHWDYWVDENGNLNIPDEEEYKLHCVERCCDWLSMSYQHNEVPNEWYNANKEAMVMTDYGFDICDEIMGKVAEFCDGDIGKVNELYKIPFDGTRGELDEAFDWQSLTPRIEADESDRNVVEHYKEEIEKGNHRCILVNSNGEILDGNHTMTAYQELGVRPPKLYLGERPDFYKAVSETKGDAEKAIDIMIKNGTAKLIEEALPSKEFLDKSFNVRYNDNNSSAEIINEDLGYEKNKLFARIKEYNPNAKEENYKNKSVGEMLAILTKYEEKSRKSKPKEEKPKIKTGNSGYKYIRNDSGSYEKLDKDYFDESFKIHRTDSGYLLEASMGQLKRTTLTQDPTRAKKSKRVQSKYIGISKYGVLNFSTSSETHSGVQWYQEVQFPSFTGFMNIVKEGDVIDATDVKKAMQSDNIKISCDDPSFLYWAWKFKAWRDVYGLEKETRAPKRNNVRLKGALCKHLYSVIELLNEKRIIDLIARDLNEYCKQKLGIKSDGYQDAEGMMQKDFKANQYDYSVEGILKTILTTEQFNDYMNGTKLEDLDLTDEQRKDIEKAIANMRDRSQFEVKSELEKQFQPAKRGRKITRDDVKLSVGEEENEEEVK